MPDLSITNQRINSDKSGMGKEIERKFLVINDEFKLIAKKSVRIRQGYLCRVPEHVVRVRTKGEIGYLTVKGKNRGMTRDEFEYEIPYSDAIEMLRMCEGRVIDKTRYFVEYEGYLWEVDEFHGDLSPLITAEIEIPEESVVVSLPGFIGQEVTGIPEYYNSNL